MLKHLSTLIALALAVHMMPPVLAHSGRTDSSGCHTCRTGCSPVGSRHCHNSGSGSDSSGGGVDIVQVVIVAGAIIIVATCIESTSTRSSFWEEGKESEESPWRISFDDTLNAFGEGDGVADLQIKYERGLGKGVSLFTDFALGVEDMGGDYVFGGGLQKELSPHFHIGGGYRVNSFGGAHSEALRISIGHKF